FFFSGSFSLSSSFRSSSCFFLFLSTMSEATHRKSSSVQPFLTSFSSNQPIVLLSDFIRVPTGGIAPPSPDLQSGADLSQLSRPSPKDCQKTAGPSKARILVV